MNLEIRKEYEAEMVKRWKGDRKFVDYCMKKAQIIVKTSTGRLVALEKPSIKKDFCFGESGYDYDEAINSARIARTSEDYFIRENLEGIEMQIKRLVDINMPAFLESNGNYENVRELRVLNPCDIYHYPWKYEYDNGMLEELSKEDRKLLLKAYEELYDAFKKRLQAYLKRYGMSKVNAWTYWREA